MGSTNLSAKAMQVIKAKLKGQEIDQTSSGMSPREWRELMEVLED